MIGAYIPGFGIVALRRGFGDQQYHPGVTLRYGSRGVEVEDLQQALNHLGYDAGTRDGIFGDKTKSAVRAFQTTAGVAVDGIVGPETWAVLRTAMETGPTAERDRAEAAAQLTQMKEERQRGGTRRRTTTQRRTTQRRTTQRQTPAADTTILVDTGPPPVKKEGPPWGKIIAITAGGLVVIGGIAYAMRGKRRAAAA